MATETETNIPAFDGEFVPFLVAVVQRGIVDDATAAAIVAAAGATHHATVRSALFDDRVADAIMASDNGMAMQGAILSAMRAADAQRGQSRIVNVDPNRSPALRMAAILVLASTSATADAMCNGADDADADIVRGMAIAAGAAYMSGADGILSDADRDAIDATIGRIVAAAAAGKSGTRQSHTATRVPARLIGHVLHARAGGRDVRTGMVKDDGTFTFRGVTYSVETDMSRSARVATGSNSVNGWQRGWRVDAVDGPTAHAFACDPAND